MTQKLVGFALSLGASLHATNTKELIAFVESYTYYRITDDETNDTFDPLILELDVDLKKAFGSQFKAVGRDHETRQYSDEFSSHIFIQVEIDNEPLMQ